MSSQRGNCSRSRPPKHQNQFAFKNQMHDKSHITKAINNIVVDLVCKRCKDVIEWKIKYKKYKPLTVPKKCTKCGEKSVKKAYYIICDPCINSTGLCGKCAQLISNQRTDGQEEEKDTEDDETESEPDI